MSVGGEASFHFDTGNQLSARQRQDHTDIDIHDITLSFLIRQIKIALFVFVFLPTNILYFVQRHLPSVREMKNGEIRLI